MIEMDSAEVAAVAGHLRVVLAAAADPDDELTVSAATGHRIEGAALALDALAAGQLSGSSTR